MEISLQVVLTSLVCTPGSLFNLPGRIPGSLFVLLVPYTGGRRGADISDVFFAEDPGQLGPRPLLLPQSIEEFYPLGPRHSNYLCLLVLNIY